jgi:putative DNA primase/helicase
MTGNASRTNDRATASVNGAGANHHAGVEDWPLHRIDTASPFQRIAGPLTQDRVAREFIVQNRHRLRFDHHRGKWFIFQHGLWRHDELGAVTELIRQFCQRMDDPNRPRLGRTSIIKSIEELCRTDRDVAVTSSAFDSHPYLLATPGEYVDLKSGRFFTPDPPLLLSQSTIVAREEGEPTRWLEFLSEATGGDAEYVGFLQRWFGYCLTGDIKEHALVFIYGPGGTGKTTLVKVMQEIFGSYARSAPMDAFTISRGDRHPTELAMMVGKRLIAAAETERGRSWAESRIKQLTGGDRIPARFMRQDFFEFDPQFKLVIVGNHAPALSSCDESMRRRFHVLPFMRRPGNKDLDLPAKLVREAGRILNWIIQGAMEWQQIGLKPPAIVESETDQYFASQDLFADWLDSECHVGLGVRDTAQHLYVSYHTFMSTRGEQAIGSKAFGDELRRRRFDRVLLNLDGKKARGWEGLRLLSQP